MNVTNFRLETNGAVASELVPAQSEPEREFIERSLVFAIVHGAPLCCPVKEALARVR